MHGKEINRGEDSMDYPSHYILQIILTKAANLKMLKGILDEA
jgi:hypothetical protein